MWRVAAIISAGLISMAAAPVQSVSELAWLSGAWVSETEEGWTEELWTAPRGGILLGTNRSGKKERITGFEFMRIAQDGEGGIDFWGSPAGKPAVAFRLTSSGQREAVFENSKHDYPTRIIYRRNGKMLVATVSGPGGSNPLSWTFKRP